MKGTQLKQLSDEYEACLENVEKTGKFLNAKRSALPDLKNVVKRANERWKTAEKAVEQMKKMDELKKEQAWAHVEEKGQVWIIDINHKSNFYIKLYTTFVGIADEYRSGREVKEKTRPSGSEC